MHDRHEGETAAKEVPVVGEWEQGEPESVEKLERERQH